MDRLLTPDEMNKAVFFEDEDGELCVKPDSYLEVAKAQRHATLEEVKGIIQASLDGLHYANANLFGKELLKAIEGLEKG